MGTQNLSYITLESVIQDYLMEADKNINRYAKVFHLGFRGMETLGLDFFYTVQSVKIPVNANFTVNLPANYLNWTKVGILNGRGGVMPLKYNENLTTYADLLPDRVEKLENPQLFSNNWNNNVWCNYWNGYFFSNIYGVPSGMPYVGSFKVDESNGVIILNEKFYWDNLILEYVASPTTDVSGGDYRLPVQFKEALIAWLWWKDNKSMNVGKGRVGIDRELKDNFYRERNLAIARWKPIRYQDIYDTAQEMSRLAVKT